MTDASLRPFKLPLQLLCSLLFEPMFINDFPSRTAFLVAQSQLLSCANFGLHRMYCFTAIPSTVVFPSHVYASRPVIIEAVVILETPVVLEAVVVFVITMRVICSNITVSLLPSWCCQFDTVSACQSPSSTALLFLLYHLLSFFLKSNSLKPL